MLFIPISKSVSFAFQRHCHPGRKRYHSAGNDAAGLKALSFRTTISRTHNSAAFVFPHARFKPLFALNHVFGSRKHPWGIRAIIIEVCSYHPPLVNIKS
jgi:hypothetical protein